MTPLIPGRRSAAFACGLLALLLGAACRDPVPGAPPAPPPPSPAEAPPPPPAHLPVVIDLHTDTLAQAFSRGVGLDDPDLEAGLPALRAGGFTAVLYADWPGKRTQARDRAGALLEFAHREDARLEAMEIARDPDHLQAIVDRGHLAVVLGLEGGHGLEPGGLATLDRWFEAGLRVLGPAWSFSTRYAGSSGDQGGGLTEEGRALVARAAALGVLLDVSHLSDAATLEVCQSSAVPVIASHSGARAVHPHPRNLTDDAIQCVAERGGVVGVVLHAPFLGPGAGVVRAADHADHLRTVGGEAVVALGTDFDGWIRTPAGLASEADLPALWAALGDRGWSEAEIAGMQGANFLRAWRSVWAARTPDPATATP
ncbi:MAG: membrane dipeptidase [Deltaproteobacteria bacterium]|nr:membrane dipeptidase [Deltaproteobacteria bacterium]